MRLISQYTMVSDMHGYDLQCGRDTLRMNRERYPRWKAACNGNLKDCIYYEHSW